MPRSNSTTESELVNGTASDQTGNPPENSAGESSLKPSTDKDPKLDVHGIGQVATDLANEFQEDVAKTLENKLAIDIPKQAGKLDDIISDLYCKDR